MYLKTLFNSLRPLRSLRLKTSFLFLAVAVAGFCRAGIEERDALAFLDYVTGPLPAAEEKEWWDIGGTQHGIFAKRYSIAFAGYAAAAIGMRGDAEVTNRVGRILGNCEIGRAHV